MKKRIILLIFMILVINFTLIVTANASSTAKELAGGYTWGGAQKQVIIVSGSAWNGHVHSYTFYPDFNIGVIGWTWWTCRETCGAQILSQWQYGASVAYNSNDWWDTSAQLKHHCATTPHKIYSMGNHDFNAPGDIWRPYLEASANIDY